MNIKIALIKRSKVREVLGRFSITEDYFDTLDMEIEKIILKSKDRAIQNKRKTLLGRDL